LARSAGGWAMIFFADLAELMRRTTLLFLLVFAAAVLPADAQSSPVMGGCAKWEAASEDARNIETHTILIKNVRINCNDVQLFADQAELLNDVDRIIAIGNVVFVSTGSRISAERLEFNTRTKTGTFFTASGIASLENRGIDRSLFGTQEPDAYFWGETIEKLGPKTYKITHGGFTTCVQPTPRWEFVANSVTLTLEKHALMNNMLLKVKDVPVFYLPAMYYPINKEDRATGFLIPIYGTSTLKGQMLKNAFFWAINRSHDATFYHDWFSKTGQGFGGEYRYIQSAASSGNLQTYVLREHDAVYQQNDGSTRTQPGINSYQINGSVLQSLPAHLRLTGSANYFSSLVAEQRSNQNFYGATNRTRSFGVNLVGNWGANTISSTVERNEIFSDVNNDNSNVTGSLPRITFSRAEKKLGPLPIYYGSSSELVTLVRTDKLGDQVKERGLSRFDIFPTVRFPFTKWPYLTFNSVVGFRETYWTESLANDGTRVPESIQRRYFTLSTTITGPVLTRIWSTPTHTYAQKFKHVIEPTFRLSRVTPIDNYNNIVQLDNTDYVVGQVTSFQYGLNNRLYAKKENAREILNVAISQSYYTDAKAAAVDREYQSSSFNATPKPTHLSPVALQLHASPTTTTDATFRTEYDTKFHGLRTLAANGGLTEGWVQTTAGWSQTRYIPGFNLPASASHFLNAATTVRRPGGSFGGTYVFNYDVKKQDFVNQRLIAHYNSQCCGLAVEYQKFNFGAASSAIGVPQDRRFNISFTLAGIGTFSDIFGAFGGQQGRR
jgi:LPS-assembly protein